MKNKYQRLSKKEKKECQKMYYSTLKGKEMHFRFVRLNITGTVGILFGCYILFHGYMNHSLKWYESFVSIILIIFSFIFFIGSYLIRKNVLNQFALKIPRFKNK